MFFGLHREFLGIGVAQDFQVCGLYFIFLSGSLAFYQISSNAQGGACGDAFQGGFGRIFKIDHTLNIV